MAKEVIRLPKQMLCKKPEFPSHNFFFSQTTHNSLNCDAQVVVHPADVWCEEDEAALLSELHRHHNANSERGIALGSELDWSSAFSSWEQENADEYADMYHKKSNIAASEDPKYVIALGTTADTYHTTSNDVGRYATVQLRLQALALSAGEG